MSLETWMEEFYPLDVCEVNGEDAAAHSLQKWLGLTAENLAKHGCEMLDGRYVSELPQGHGLKHLIPEPLEVNSDTCALCYHYYDDEAGHYLDRDEPGADGRHACTTCPLAIARDGVPCDNARSDELRAPYVSFISSGDPGPMIHWLKQIV